MEIPFFIVGSGRSGSTFLYHLLEGHERIGLTNEARVADFLYLCHKFAALPAHEERSFSVQTRYQLTGLIGNPYSNAFSRIFDHHTREMLLEFYRGQFPDKEITHFGDKLTDPHVARAINNLFADTRYIILIRDPRDVLCSLRAFAARDEVKKINPHLLDQTPEQFADHWASLYRSSISYLSGHLLLRYEDLIEDPLGQTRKALSYLNLELSAEHAARISSRDTFSGHGTSKSVAASCGRWREELEPDEVATVQRICGALMQEHGYELSR